MRNRRRGGRVDWSPPGGVIDPGEDVESGLTREVAEETGLEVARWRGPLYRIECEAPQLGWNLRVFAYGAAHPGGALRFADPDGIVEDGAFYHDRLCREQLADAPRWVREPLCEFLGERWEGTRRFDYLIEGSQLSSLRVTRRTPDHSDHGR